VENVPFVMDPTEDRTLERIISLNFGFTTRFINATKIWHVNIAWNNGYIPIIPKSLEQEVARLSVKKHKMQVISKTDDGEIVDTDIVKYVNLSFDSGHYQMEHDTIIHTDDFSHLAGLFKMVK
jgi:hypothetical protein